MLTRKELIRAAAILEKIHVLGDELAAIVENEKPDLRTDMGIVHHFATEQLGLDPEVWTTPKMLADRLRILAQQSKAA